MNMTQCPYCGETRFAPKRVNYLYSHQSKFLLVPNTPAECCENCGMEFYAGDVVKEIERRFNAIHARQEEPDEVLQIPTKAFV